MKDNIFQGNEQINRVIANSLEIEDTNPSKSETRLSTMLSKYYFRSFFYLTKRFGLPVIFDDYKDAGVWIFEVKSYLIQIRLDTNYINISIFGDTKYFKHTKFKSPYWVGRSRREEHYKEIYPEGLLCPTYKGNPSSVAKGIFELAMEDFCIDNKIDENITDEEFQDKYGVEFYLIFLRAYNDILLNINQKIFTNSYGEEYSNAHIRHALKTLSQFLKNMLSPISIRDCYYNIKGRCDNTYSRYNDNIDIVCINDKYNGIKMKKQNKKGDKNEITRNY